MPTRAALNEEELERAFDEHGFDAVVACSGPGASYLSGVHSPPSRIGDHYVDSADSPRRMLVVWPRDGDPVLVIQQSSIETARRESWTDEVRTYEEYVESPYVLAAECLRDRGLDRGTVGVERREMGVARWESFRNELPDADLRECTGVLERVRQIKTPEELALLERADGILDGAFDAVFGSAGVGDTERDLQRAMTRECLEAGADAASGWFHVRGTPYMRAGSDGDPSIAAGDVLRSDFTVYVDGYPANLSRHAVVGPPSDEQERQYAALLDVHRTTVRRTFRPGVPVREVCESIHDSAETHGLDAGGGSVLFGHGIGCWTVHESPVVHPGEQSAFREGMVVVAEPKLEDFWHLQDMVHITDDGPEWISDRSNSERMTVIGAA